jgi:hypothetical protein
MSTLSVTSLTTGTATTSLTLATGNTAATGMFLSSNGNVGIGTTTPNYSGYGTSNLTVRGRTTLQGVLELVGNKSDTTGNAVGDINFFAESNTLGSKKIASIQSSLQGNQTGNKGGALAFCTKGDGSSPFLSRMFIDNAGNVGIGTSSPTAKLEVLGYMLLGPTDTTTTYQGMSIRNGKDSSIAETISYIDAQNNLTIADSNIFFAHQTDGGSFMGFATTPAGSRSADRRVERMRIDSSGHLLMGTTSPIVTSYGGNYGVDIGTYNGNQGTVAIGATITSSVDMMQFINPNGLVGRITVSGSATSYVTSSDYRLKENITPMTTGLATVKALKPVTYDWISDKSAGEGFLAHELQAIIPLAVTGEKDAVDENGVPCHQSIDYSKVVVHLVAAIQELEARLAKLEAK